MDERFAFNGSFMTKCDDKSGYVRVSKGVREGVQAIQAIKYRKYVAGNYILAHAHLWHGSTQIQIKYSKVGTTSMRIVS